VAATGNDGRQAPITQLDALRAIPASDMLVDPAQLELVLEEPSSEDRLSRAALIGWTLASLAVTIIAAIWWAATGH
jgi:hypothetical protein